MKKFQKYFAATMLSGAMLFNNLAQARAMAIDTYAHLSSRDQVDYMLYLVSGTKTYLASHGYSTEGQQVRNYFIVGTSGVGPGVDSFTKNLIARSINLQNANNPAKQQYQVENAFALTLERDLGVTIPINDLLAMAQDFKPSSGSDPTVVH